MNKQAPSVARIITMLGFAFSCFAILLYLWLTFGGSVPLAPKGYRVHAVFPEATTLAQEADVRISGVKVGEVKTKSLDEPAKATNVVLEIEPRYAPLPKDVQATLRQKTLLGETYVELTPGSKGAEPIDDGGTIAPGQIGDTVQLDEIFRSFDAPTRRAFRVWLDQQGKAVGGRGADLNAALGNLQPFAEDANTILKILRQQQSETRTLVRDTGVVFDALTERDGQLADLITNSNRVFETTASRDQALADTFRILPTFIEEGRITTDRLTTFARQTNPLITQLRPAARELSPTLITLRTLAPDLKGLFKDLGPLIDVSKKGIPATEQFLKDTKPVLQQLDPFLRDVNPILDWLGLYKREIASFFALDVAATQATDRPRGSSTTVHYLRTANPINPENLAAYPRRIATNRPNPYTAPGLHDLHPLKVFGTYACGTAAIPPLAPPGTPPPDPLPLPIAPGAPGLPIPSPPTDQLPAQLRDLINTYAYNNGNPVAPPCEEQPPLGQLLGQTGKYPHVVRDPAR
ncbi:MAG: phospholipid/cholesterol/gamma-HCH transport system substrate-binding protein [Solirubrobacteraceae bacterium]|nr:phospholipid/cholesterol/gamma-HCH transport system substrate-binding protein [Solirubrobacteraceae bacterium]